MTATIRKIGESLQVKKIEDDAKQFHCTTPIIRTRLIDWMGFEKYRKACVEHSRCRGQEKLDYYMF